MTQTDQQHVPTLRFPGFEGEWTSKTLGELCELQAGKFVRAADIQEEQAEGLFRCYGGNGLRGYVNGYNRDGTFPLVGRQGALCGNVHLVSGQFHATEHAMVAEPKDEVDTSWLFHQLGRMNLNQYSTGLAQPGLSADVVKQVGTKAPTLPEQRKIASFLGAVDTKIAQLARKKALLEDYKKGCMQQLFSQKIRFKDDDGNDFPDWEEKHLGEIVSIKKGQQLNRDDMIENAEYPVINGGVSASGYTDTFNTKGGVITVSEGGNSCGYVDWQSHDFWLGGHCYALPLRDITSYAEYVLQFLKNSQASIMALRVGSGLPNIQKRDLEKLLISLPHPDEQRKIADFLSAIDRKIDLVGQELSHARTFKQGLLQQMFV